jgi:hypothetical protein
MKRLFTLITIVCFLSCKKAPSPIVTKLVVMNYTQTLQVNGVMITTKPYIANLEVGKTYTCVVGGSTNYGIYLNIDVEGMQTYKSGTNYSNTFTYLFKMN